MTDATPLLEAARQNAGATGILPASAYVRAMDACLADGRCAAKFFNNSTPDQWAACLKEAEGRLTYRDDGMAVLGGAVPLSPQSFRAFGPHKDAFKARGLPKVEGACLVFDAVITTSRKDRDGDVLEPAGALVDPSHPLLWQHIPLEPIGKHLGVLKQDETQVVGSFAVIDSELGRDAAQLIEFGALRISHGFRPIEFEPLKRAKQDGDRDHPEQGFWVKRYEIMETSVVSIPSNVGAVITAYSRQKLHHPLVKSWAGTLYEQRPTVVSTAGLDIPAPEPLTIHLVLPELKGASRGCDDCPAGEPCSCGKQTVCPKCQGKVANGRCVKCGAEVPAKSARAPGRKTADPVRWNKSHGPAFDVAAQPLEASTLLYDWVSRHIGCEIKHLYRNATLIPSARMGTWLTGLKHTLSEHRLVDVRNLHGNKEAPPVYQVMQLNSKQRDDFLVNGTAFYQGGRGKFVVGLSPNWAGLEVTVYTHEKSRDLNHEVLDRTWQWAKENNFLKGEAFALSGEFLERTSEGWDDVILEEKNKKAIQRVADLLNAKGKSFANRGVIMTGPAGTGKTLSGRILRNTAAATFIWVSSRDFHYAGSFGGISFGFELAKELAPSVLFIEDVDNWLYDTTVDLIKTEMDGISRSTGVLTVLTTNFPERLPEALIDRPGRFHDVLRFDVPTSAAREAMLRKWLPALPEPQLRQAVAETDGYSGAHVYELAHFARTLQEHDGMDATAAVREALTKVKEQRELITEMQLEGSNYQPRRRDAKLWQKSAGRAADLHPPAPVRETLIVDRPGEAVEIDAAWMKALEGGRIAHVEILDRGVKLTTEHGGTPMGVKAGRAVSAKNRQALEESHELFGETAEHPKTTAPHKELCSGAMKRLKEVLGEVAGDLEEGAAKPQKAGRVLSKENQARIQEAHDLADEMCGHEKMHRVGKVLLREAKGHLQGVLDGANPGITPEPNPGTGEPNPETAKHTPVADLVCKLTGALLLGERAEAGPLLALKELVDEAAGQATEQWLAAAGQG